MKISNASQPVSKENLRQLLLAVLEGLAIDVASLTETTLDPGEEENECGIN